MPGSPISPNPKRSANKNTGTTTSNGKSKSNANANANNKKSSSNSNNANANANANAGSSVQVAIRIRPLLSFEAGTTQCVEALKNDAVTSQDAKFHNVVRIGGDNDRSPAFCFDQVFDGTTQQDYLFTQRIVPLLESCLQGYNATTLAYGQTGSGKTFTMTGPTTTMQDGPHAGIIPRAIQSIFRQLKQTKQVAAQDSYEYTIRLQFLELYGEEIRDLLSSRSTKLQKLQIRDLGDGAEPEVLGATQHVVECADEALLCLARGMMRRVTGSTAMNATSSRSHAILSVLVEQSSRKDPTDVASVVKSKFNFVDLAGSERQKRTKAEGQRLKEGIDINKGLLVLGNVISALGDPKKAGKTFVPYRDSKLTRLLKGSLGGNHKTLMIACVSPSSSNLEESLNCLRYANRAKNIQNNAVVNVDAKTRLLQELRQSVSMLAEELLRIKKHGGNAEEPNMFSVDMLEGLVVAEDVAAATAATATPLKKAFATPGFATPNEKQQQQLSEQLRIAESQLDQTRHVLQQRTNEYNSMTEDIFTLRAEKELYRLKLQATTSGEGDEEPTTVDANFLEKAAAYEREIATLKEAVQASSMFLKNTSDDDNGKGIDDANDALRLAQATKSLQHDKEQLQLLQSQLSTASSTDEDDGIGSPEMDGLKTRVLQSMSATTQLEAEEVAADAELSAITKTFLKNEDEDDDNGAHDGEDDEEEAEDAKTAERIRKQKLEASLMELSATIQEKETLIQQLEQTQKKYSTMRDFYEGKLRQMEVQVRERELERECLVAELKKVEHDSRGDLEQQLRDKERHIHGLKKRRGELAQLTKVSSRNEAQMEKLKREIVEMKHKRVDLQKMIHSERKSHVGEINRLKKEVMQRDREANKWKHISNKKAVEAEKAQQVAKARLEQLGALKVKYTQAEKNLRLKTVKRGVMEKAGLDSVMVGRKGKTKASVAAVRDFLDRKVADISKKEALADKLANEWEDRLELASKQKKLSDQRITRATSEAIKNLDVQIKYKEERIRRLAEKIGKPDGSKDAKQDVAATQLAFFEDAEFKKLVPDASPLQAVQLTSRVLFGMVVRERRRVATLARTAWTLNEKAKEAQEIAAEKEAAFRSFKDEERMEREQLAQTQQEQILSLMAMVKDDSVTAVIADLSFEERRLHESMPTIGVAAKTISSPRMALLANERVEVLERQLEELRGERESMETYKKLERKTRSDLSAKNKECEKLQKEASELRETLRTIRDDLSRKSMNDESEGGFSSTEGEILGVVNSAIKSSRRKSISTESSLAQGFEDTDSDADEDEDVPAWAGDIMADLAIIAEGLMPDALKETPGVMPKFEEELAPTPEAAPPSKAPKSESESKEERRSVFDRLTNPINFTGVQKRKTEQQQARSSVTRESKISKPTVRVSRNQEERKALSVKVSEQLDGFFQGGDLETPPVEPPTKPRKSRDAKEEVEHRSVFERLLSPSNYTGTQKEKMQKVQQKKSREADVLLDELLASKHGITSPPALAEVGITEQQRKAQDEMAKKVAERVSEYTQMDVFERLQQSTTQSYSVKNKHGGRSVHSPSRATIEEENEASNTAPETPPRASLPPSSEMEDLSLSSPLKDKSEYTQLNVFERLQMTTTEAFAKKTNNNNPDAAAAARSTSPRAAATVSDDREGVFERLQKTTTHSFAGKHSARQQGDDETF